MDLKPIAVQVYSVRETAKADLVGALKRIAKAGYAGVETAGLYGNNAAEIRKVLDDLGLVCCSTHGPFPTAQTVAQRVDEAAALGTRRVVSGLGPADFATGAARAASCEKLATAVELVSAAGMTFGMHNHWWEFDAVDGEVTFDYILRSVPGLFSELDVYWAHNFGAVNPVDVLARHKGRIPLLHIKDGPLVKDQPHTAVGEGKADIPAIVGAADAKVMQWLIVELDACATDMWQAVEKSVRYLIDARLGSGRKTR